MTRQEVPSKILNKSKLPLERTWGVLKGEKKNERNCFDKGASSGHYKKQKKKQKSHPRWGGVITPSRKRGKKEERRKGPYSREGEVLEGRQRKRKTWIV